MKKTTKKIHFIIPLVIYPFDVMVIMNQTNEEVRKILSKYDHLNDDDIELAMFNSETIRGRAALFSSNATLLRLKNIPCNTQDYGVLQHEICHVVNYIMDNIGMKLKIGTSDEAYAYLTGYLTEKIYDRF